MNFSDLKLSEDLIKTVNELKFVDVTPIQQSAIPLILEGHDLIAKAQTGSGKTAAYVLPILNQLNCKFEESLQVLVLVPTRELALQVSNEFKQFGRHLHPKQNVLPITGGENIDQQTNSLKLPRQIIVATPGRLLELLKLGRITLSEIKFLVFDEADKILNLGFAAEVDLILDQCPESTRRQNLFFSATFPEKLKVLVERVSQNFKHISIENENDTNVQENIEQRAIEVLEENKGPLLRHLIKEEKWEHVLVFVASKKAAQNVSNKLQKAGIEAEAFHGDLNHEQRNLVFTKFTNKKIKVLVSTDLASRGIDISNLSHVVNYDLPRSPNDYVHRIGRSGRAGQKGHAISFLTRENEAHFKLIEKRARIRLPREKIDGF